jgi:hypothetical protein
MYGLSALCSGAVRDDPGSVLVHTTNPDTHLGQGKPKIGEGRVPVLYKRRPSFVFIIPSVSAEAKVERKLAQQYGEVLQ